MCYDDLLPSAAVFEGLAGRGSAKEEWNGSSSLRFVPISSLTASKLSSFFLSTGMNYRVYWMVPKEIPAPRTPE
jgi:hypothetical protein